MPHGEFVCAWQFISDRCGLAPRAQNTPHRGRRKKRYVLPVRRDAHAAPKLNANMRPIAVQVVCRRTARPVNQGAARVVDKRRATYPRKLFMSKPLWPLKHNPCYCIAGQIQIDRHHRIPVKSGAQASAAAACGVIPASLIRAYQRPTIGAPARFLSSAQSFASSHAIWSRDLAQPVISANSSGASVSDWMVAVIMAQKHRMSWLIDMVPQREHVELQQHPSSDSYGSPSHLCSHGPPFPQAQ